jgi:hypothetical protein
VTDRVLRIFEKVRSSGNPRVTLERAVCFTESFKTTEEQPMVLRCAKGAQARGRKYPRDIFDDELKVETGRGSVGHLHTIRLPVCPRMQPTETRWYAVDGYCVLDGSPGCLMIPSMDLFQRYCTTPCFPECPWFAKRAEKKGELPLPTAFRTMVVV